MFPTQRHPDATSFRLPRLGVARVACSVLARRPRSFTRDAHAAIAALHPPPAVLGAEHVPPDGPCLVTCNHYTRPGFGSWWLVLSVTAAVAAQRVPGADREIHWVIAGAWTYPPGDWRRRVVTPLTYRAFARVAHVYDMVTMPPMPPDPDQVEQRASAVRRTLRLGRRLVQAGGMLGLAPEGRDVQDGPEHLLDGPEYPGRAYPARGLGEPPTGVGEFITLLVRLGFPVLPVGVSEPDGRLTLSFGPPFVPDVPAEKAERDGAVTRQVMAAIVRQMDGPGTTL